MVTRLARVFVDSNILLRFIIKSSPLHDDVRTALDAVWSSGGELWISRQVVREVASVMTRPQTYSVPVTAPVAAQQMRALGSSFLIADETGAVADALLGLMETIPMGGKQIHDANIAATMRAYGIPHLLTLNVSDFARFSHLITLVLLESLLSDTQGGPS